MQLEREAKAEAREKVYEEIDRCVRTQQWSKQLVL